MGIWRKLADWCVPAHALHLGRPPTLVELLEKKIRQTYRRLAAMYDAYGDVKLEGNVIDYRPLDMNAKRIATFIPYNRELFDDYKT